MADRDLIEGRAGVRVLILGGGPAGCAAALTLRRYLPGVAVAQVARTAADAPAVGETLSPGVLPLLDYLGLREAFQGMGHLPCGGTASAWGGGQVMERSYLFTGRGQGWHLDRAGFDDWLWERAAQAGTHGLRARATRAQRVNGVWQVDLDGGGSVQAEVVIDASGRAAWLARHEEALPQRDDALVAEARWYGHDAGQAASDGALVESVADGWWYSATLPGQRGVAMFMTDHDLRAHRSWDARLDAAPATAARLASWRADGGSVVRAANSQCGQAVAGDGWVAAGDAAAAFDPISSMGIGFSLRSGMEAARVAAGMLDGDGDAEADVAYAASIRQIYADYRSRLAGIYALERRWPQETFWQRRQSSITVSQPKVAVASGR
jgi:flavin-dependent dehydrogenase